MALNNKKMTNYKVFFLTITTFILLTGCEGISKEKYENVISQVESLKVTIKDKQKTIDELNKKLSDSDRENNEEIDNLNKKISDYETKFKEKKQHLLITGTCLQGVVQAMDRVGKGDEAGALLNLSSVARECRQAGEIMEEIEKEKDQALMRSSNAINSL